MPKQAFVLLIFLCFLCSSSVWAQKDLTRILFVFDASNSMHGKWDESTRIAIAKEVLVKTVDSLKNVPNLELALRVYGHQSPITPTFQDCEDTKLEIPFAPGNHGAIQRKIRQIQPKGTTPIARSLEAAADDFPDKNARNIIILITDGIEACDNDPCTIADKLRAKGITIRPFVIGVGIDMEYLNYFDCIGTYLDANDKNSFIQVMQTVVNAALLATTVQVNLNNIYGKPIETNVSFNLYKAGTKQIVFTYTHTLNRNRLPDTLIIDDKTKYDIEVFTTPVVRASNITLKPKTHNIIEVDAPRGSLQIRLINPTRSYDILTRVYRREDNQTLNVQRLDETDLYIVGNYEIEILTLPRIYKSVEIKQSSLNTVHIPAPGQLKYSSGNRISGQIFVLDKEGNMEWVTNLSDSALSGTYYLQPGEYLLVYRSLLSMNTLHTTRKRFRIVSNKTTTLNL
jgi:Ca-activated chloride channel family protein